MTFGVLHIIVLYIIFRQYKCILGYCILFLGCYRMFLGCYNRKFGHTTHLILSHAQMKLSNLTTEDQSQHYIRVVWAQCCAWSLWILAVSEEGQFFWSFHLWEITALSDVGSFWRDPSQKHQSLQSDNSYN